MMSVLQNETSWRLYNLSVRTEVVCLGLPKQSLLHSRSCCAGAYMGASAAAAGMRSAMQCAWATYVTPQFCVEV